MEKGKLIKVIFEYENTTSILEGEEMCEGWLSDIDGVLQTEQARNNITLTGLEKAKWKDYTKKEIRKLKLNKLKNIKL